MHGAWYTLHVVFMNTTLHVVFMHGAYNAWYSCMVCMYLYKPLCSWYTVGHVTSQLLWAFQECHCRSFQYRMRSSNCCSLQIFTMQFVWMDKSLVNIFSVICKLCPLFLVTICLYNTAGLHAFACRVICHCNRRHTSMVTIQQAPATTRHLSATLLDTTATSRSLSYFVWWQKSFLFQTFFTA